MEKKDKNNFFFLNGEKSKTQQNRQFALFILIKNIRSLRPLILELNVLPGLTTTLGLSNVLLSDRKCSYQTGFKRFAVFMVFIF